MAKRWSDVSASPDFQALTPEDQELARSQYFDDVIAPQLDPGDWDEARSQFDTDTRIARRSLPAGVKPSDAGAGRGGAEFAATDPRLNANRRGGTRSEARPYVPGQGPAPEQAPQQQIGDLTAAQLISQPGTATEADLIQASKSPATLEAERAAMRPRAEARPWNPTRAEQAAGAVRDLTGSQAAGQAAARAVDTALLAPETLATFGKLGADVANLATLGAAEPVSQWFGALVKTAQDQKSPRFLEQRAQLQRLLQDKEAGVGDVLEFLAANPGFAAETAIPSLPSTLVGAGSGRALGALNRAIATRRGADAAGRAAAFDTGAVAGAGLGNAALNAGATFSETNGDVVDKLAAAVPAAAGTALLGRMPGAESVLARGGAIGRSRPAAALGTAAAEGVQEAGESLSQSLGKGAVEGNFDIDTALKQAAVEGTAGAIVGGGIGAVSQRPGTNFTPADSTVARAGITPVVVPVGQADAPQVDSNVDAPASVVDATARAEGITPARGARPDFTKAMQALAEREQEAEAKAKEPEAPKPQEPAPPAAPAQPPADAEKTPPASTWTGRRGDGYVTEVDAQQALPGRQRKQPELDWRVEPRADGKFVVNGYTRQQQETANVQPITDGAGAGVPAVAADAQPAAGPVTESGDVPGGQQLGEAGGARGAAEVGGTAVAVDAATIRSDFVAIQDARLKRSGGTETVKLEVVDREQAPELTRLAAAVRAPITFIRDANGKATFSGVAKDGRIYINVDGEDAALAIAVHEAVHTMPEGIKKTLISKVMDTVTPEQRAKFLWKYQGYGSLTADKQNEELVAMIAQDDSKRPEFWNKLSEKLGDSDFGKLARHIVGVLDKLLDKIRGGNDTRFTTDIVAVRDAIAEALARTSRGETFWEDDLAVSGDGGVDVSEMTADEAGFSEGRGDAEFSERGRKDEAGNYELRAYKDGSIDVYGDVDEIRAQLPDDVRGRATAGGISFTASDSSRVRAALEGRDVAYSRAGAVTDKMPMKGDKYLGAPPGYDTPAKIPKLRRILRQLADEGAPGRFWYESSSKSVLDMVGGNVSEARKFVALLAIYSPQAKVDANSTFALRAWAQYKAGQPVSVKTAVMDKKAADAMADVDKFWSDEKTGNFFHNLLREIDPSTAGRQGATIDMWMMRAGQYDNDAPTKTQYAFMENETNRLARDLGWEPQQVQAAIWVAMKARMENAGVKKRTEAKSEKRGWISFTKDGKGKKVRVIHDAQRHRDNWLATAMEHVVSGQDTAAAKFDFGDGLRRHIGQVSWEARPSRVSGVLPGVNDATYARQVEFQQAVQKALVDDNGVDLLAQQLGLLVEGEDILAPGAWQGEISAGMQKRVAMAPAKGNDGKTQVDAAEKKLLNVYAATLGLLLRQDGLGWHRPFYSSRKRDANGLDLRWGRTITETEMRDLNDVVASHMSAVGVSDWQDKMAFVSSPTGVRVINFGAIANDELHSTFADAIAGALPDAEAVVFASDSDMPVNDWKTNTNGQDYVQRIGQEGRSDILDWARAVLAPRVQAVFDDFSRRYDWGDAGSISFSDAAAADAVDVRDDSRVRGSARPLAADGWANPESRGTSLEGLPAAVEVDGRKVVFSGFKPAQDAARAYAEAAGIDYRPPTAYAKVDRERGRRIADAFTMMKHSPQDPEVKAAYRAMIDETVAQYRAILETGLKVEFIDFARQGDPYGNPRNAILDVVNNNHLWVFSTRDGFGTDAAFDPVDNPLLEETEFVVSGQRALANDIFRVVHDYFGHVKDGVGFRAEGEENAWRSHSAMYTPLARRAMTTETRGQNSWLNFGPNGDSNRTAKTEDTVFADQKVGLLPTWVSEDGVDFSEQGDLFRGEFASRRSTVQTGRQIDSNGGTMKGGNIDSAGHQISMTKQGLTSFWRWFGNSEVVDDSSRPMVLYHSTNADAAVLRPGQKSSNNYGFLGNVDVTRAGVFMTPDREFSQEYLREESGQNVMPLYAKIENALDLRSGLSESDEAALEQAGVNTRYVLNIQNYWELFDNADDGTNEFVDGMRRAGYDGAIFREASPGGESDGGTTYVALDSSQIKSAIGNRGSFDSGSDDIRFSESPWYSALSRALAKGPGQANSDQWRMFLKGLPAKGVKPDEIEWSGIEQWLQMQAGKISREAVLAFVDGNGVKVEETVRGGRLLGKDADDELYRWVEENGNEESSNFNPSWREFYDSVLGGDTSEETLHIAKRLGVTGVPRELIQGAYDGFLPDGPEKPKYGQYTLPGGANYREVLLTLPERRPLTGVWRDMADRYGDDDPRTVAAKKAARAEAGMNAPKPYRSSHWDQPNVLAHIRVNDRVDADGKRVLFVEEIQSDWAQEGKKKGFASADDVKPVSKKVFDKFIDGLLDDYIAAGGAAGESRQAVERRGINMHLPDMAAALGRSDEYRRMRAGRDLDMSGEAADKIPRAPFVGKTDAWVALAIKRVISMAARDGYDRVAFVTGDQAADRFDLSKQVDAIDYRRVTVGAGDEFDLQLVKDGEIQKTLSVRERDLEDHVGKEIATKIVAGDGEKRPGVRGGMPMTRLSGIDLKVGGKGMLAFYDKIVPGVVKDVLRKVGGGSLTTVELQIPGLQAGMRDPETGAVLGPNTERQAGTNLDAPGFDITPAMRESAAGGLPMFSDYENEKTRFGRKFLAQGTPPKRMRASDLRVGSVKSDAATAELTSWIDSEYPIVNAARKAGDAVGDAMKMAVEALPGRTADASDRAHDAYVKPLVDAMGEAAKKLKLAPAQLVDAYGIYRVAKHAAERNDTLRANGSKKANPSGMSEAEAGQWQTFFASEPQLLRALESFDPMLKTIQDQTDAIKLAAGLLTQEDIDARSDWDWYISLRGDPGADEVGGVRRQGGWNNDVDPKAKGRDSLSANPIVNTVKMLENAVRLAEMARVKKAIYEFAEAHPDIIKAKVSRLYSRPFFDENGNFAKAVPNRDKFADDAVVYRDGDTEYHIEIGDGMVLEAIKRMERDDMGKVVKLMGKFTGTLGRLWTQFSPHFPLVNFLRDLQQQLAYVAGSEIKTANGKISSAKAAWMIVTRYPATFGAAVNEVMGRAPAGKYSRYAREMVAAGGASGWTKMLSDEDSLTDFVKRVEWKAGKSLTSLTWTKFVDFVAGISEVFELTTRVSVYSVLRDLGMDTEPAANYTKNLLNFSKSGVETRKLGNMYMFLRPAVQDVYKTSQLLRTRKGAMVFASMYTGAVLLYSMLREMSGDDDEDPRLKRMDKRTAAERRGYYILPVGDKEPARIPVGFGLPRMAWGLAVATVDGMRNPDYDVADAADNVVKSMTSTLSPLQLSDINMFKEPASFLATTFAPTLLVPVIEHAQNKAKGGNTIFKNNSQYSAPDYAKAFASTPNEWKDATQWMYDNSGGKVDVSPETLQFLLRSYGGGPATLIINGFATNEKMRQGQAFGPRDIPIVQAFTGPRDRYPERRFRDLSKEIDEAEAKMKDSDMRGGKLSKKLRADKNTMVKSQLKKSVDDIEREESKALADIREIQLQDYDEGARQTRALEAYMRQRKQELLDEYNHMRTSK